MILETISLLNFKNIAEADITFSENINCFLGNNGMGKTNLLDAIYYLSFCKSFYNISDSQNIKHGEEFFMIRGNYLNSKSGESSEINCGVKLKQKKTFKRDKKEYDKLSEHIGYIPLVIVSPEDSELVKEGSEVRRKFIDQTLSQFNREYLAAIIAYNKALTTRNVMLRRGDTEAALYEVIEAQMEYSANYIYKCRKEFIGSFVVVFNSFYQQICGGGESVTLSYSSHLNDGTLAEQLAQSREKDRILGYTTRGIHRDDLDMKLGNHNIKRVGSQGQTKTFAIALRFAQYEYLKKMGGKNPILLLDDIFDKLDSNRVERIMNRVSTPDFGQIFVTDTNREYLDAIVRKSDKKFKLFGVENGVIKEI